MVPTIRTILKSVGKTSQGDDAFQWSSDLDIVRVKVVPGESESDIIVSGDARLDMLAAFGTPALFLILLATGLGATTAFGWTTAAAVIIPTAWLVGRVAWQIVGTRFEAKLRALTEKLVEQTGGGDANA